jgi:hypothetical protein
MQPGAAVQGVSARAWNDMSVGGRKCPRSRYRRLRSMILTLIMRNRFEIFYARGGRWSLHTAKTHSGHSGLRAPRLGRGVDELVMP